MLRVHLTSTSYSLPPTHIHLPRPQVPFPGSVTVVAPGTGSPRLAAIWLTSRPNPAQPYQGKHWSHQPSAISHQMGKAMSGPCLLLSPFHPTTHGDRLGYNIVQMCSADVVHTIQVYDAVQILYIYALCIQEMLYEYCTNALCSQEILTLTYILCKRASCG